MKWFAELVAGEVKQHLAIVHTVSEMVKKVVDEHISYPLRKLSSLNL